MDNETGVYQIGILFRDNTIRHIYGKGDRTTDFILHLSDDIVRLPGKVMSMTFD